MQYLKSVLVGIPIGVTFFDCVGFVAKVEGIHGPNKVRYLSSKLKYF